MRKDSLDPVHEPSWDALYWPEISQRDSMEDCRDVFTGKMALITAHPDDEVLWAGGLIQHGDFTVICCSVPRHDPIRAYKFFECCETLGVKSRLLPFSEGEPGKEFPHLIALGDLSEFDGVLTHNKTGEYGHLHHKQVHSYVVENYKGPIFTFGFGEGEFAYRLTEDEFDNKMEAIQKYNHVLPYEGEMVEKSKALLHRYMKDQDIGLETFDAR